MENSKKLRKLRAVVLWVCIPLEIIETATFIYALYTGNWMPYLLGLAVVISGAVWLTAYYHQNIEYICPRCHTQFRPRFFTMFWAVHTPTTRKLTCTACGHKGFCVEVYGKRGDTSC